MPEVKKKKQVDSVSELQKGLVGQEAPTEQEQTAHVSSASIPQAPSKKGNGKVKVEEKKKKERGLSVREMKAIALILEGKTKKDALIAAGYSENTATHNPNSVLGKNVVVRALMRAFERKGLTEDMLAEKHFALLDAKKVVPIGMGDYVECADGQTQIRAVELAYKIRGNFAPEVHAVVTESYANRIKRLRGQI